MTSQVEGVQGHLRGRLSDGLSCNCADIFARVDDRLEVLGVVKLAELVLI